MLFLPYNFFLEGIGGGFGHPGHSPSSVVLIQSDWHDTSISTLVIPHYTTINICLGSRKTPELVKQMNKKIVFKLSFFKDFCL